MGIEKQSSSVSENNEAQLTPEQIDVEQQLKEAMAQVVLTPEQDELYGKVTDESLSFEEQEVAMKKLLSTLPPQFVDMTAEAVDDLMIDKVTERSNERMAAMSDSRQSLKGLSMQIGQAGSLEA